MSLQVLSAVWHLNLPPRQKLLLLCLGDHADPYGLGVYPTVATMSRMTSMPERTVQRTLADLKAKGILILVPDAQRKSPAKIIRLGIPEYRIMIEGLEEAVEPNLNKLPRKLRAEVIEVFGQTCQYCGESGDATLGPDGKRWHVDRLTPGKHGGRYVSTNVTLSCETCNRSKGTKAAPNGTSSLEDRRGAKTAPPGVPNETGEGCQSEQIGGANAAPEPKTRPEPKSNPLWDALVDGLGICPVTRSEKSNFGGVVKQLKEVGATPDQIVARCYEYRRRFGPGIDLTANALAKHWSSLGRSRPEDNGQQARGSGRSPEPSAPSYEKLPE